MPAGGGSVVCACGWMRSHIREARRRAVSCVVLGRFCLSPCVRMHVRRCCSMYRSVFRLHTLDSFPPASALPPCIHQRCYLLVKMQPLRPIKHPSSLFFVYDTFACPLFNISPHFSCPLYPPPRRLRSAFVLTQSNTFSRAQQQGPAQHLFALTENSAINSNVAVGGDKTDHGTFGGGGREETKGGDVAAVPPKSGSSGGQPI